MGEKLLGQKSCFKFIFESNTNSKNFKRLIVINNIIIK